MADADRFKERMDALSEGGATSVDARWGADVERFYADGVLA